MQAIVTGPFITPKDADPPKTIVRPSGDPEQPTVVELPASAFTRQRALGNVTSAEAHELRRKAEREASRRRAEIEREAAAIEARAMLDVEVRMLVEDFESLDGMDKPALVELAMRRKLNVNTRRSEDLLRKDVRAALEPLVQEATAEPEK